MKKLTKNRLAMYRTVMEIVSANQTVWEGIPVFVSTIEKLSYKVDLIEEKEQVQRLSTVGVVAARDTFRSSSLNELMRISGALSALGKSKGDDILHLQMKISPSRLSNSTRSEFLSLLASIVNCAAQHVDELAPYGISAQEITDLYELKANLSASSIRPVTARIERKGSTLMIDILEREINDLLKNELDEIMKIVKAEHADFYAAYKNARTLRS